MKLRHVMALLGLSIPGMAAAPDQKAPLEKDALTQGLYWLYHGRYQEAEDYFTRYCQARPNDPEGYFYKTATNWWELAQKVDERLPDIENRFEENYQKTIRVAEAAFNAAPDKKTKAKALLYWGGAEGLKGRWLVTQKVWTKAYFRGKAGHRLLRQAIKMDPDLYDAYMGLGIYDYFTDTLPGVQKVLAYLFIHGDKKRGLQELQWAIDRGTHARVEAMIFLIEIYTAEEDTPEKALPLAQQLRKEFPQSSVMHLTEITVLYNMKKWPEMAKESQLFLERSQKGIPYYTADGVRPARYCLGLNALYHRRDLDLAMAYFSQILQTIDNSRWVSYAFLRRGQVYDLRGDRESALRDYRTVLSRPDLWGSHREAQDYLRTPFTF